MKQISIFLFFFFAAGSFALFTACENKPPTEKITESTTEIQSESTTESTAEIQNEPAVETPSEVIAEAAAEMTTETTQDAAQEQIPEDNQEIVTIGDVNQPDLGMPCDNKVAKEWPFIATVSKGEIKATSKDGGFEATVDASAGGNANAKNNPFIYLDLNTGKKVEINDFAAYTNTSWALAFKRVAIRSNSGDSGQGKVKVAKLSQTTFEAVTAIPPNTTFLEDITLDPNCDLYTDPIGTPRTVFNDLNPNNPSGSESWYNYVTQGGPPMIVPFEGDIYLIQDGTLNKHYKLQILAWASGVYTLRWQELP